jgi:hypothetical protein
MMIMGMMEMMMMDDDDDEILDLFHIPSASSNWLAPTVSNLCVVIIRSLR